MSGCDRHNEKKPGGTDPAETTEFEYDEADETAFHQAGMERPRVLMDTDRFDRLRELIASEPETARIFEHFRGQADALLDEPVLVRGEVGKRMLNISRQAVNRMTLHGVAWQVNWEQCYADRIREDCSP